VALIAVLLVWVTLQFVQQAQLAREVRAAGASQAAGDGFGALGLAHAAGYSGDSRSRAGRFRLSPRQAL
jgi:hypothetical protein